MMSNNVGDRTYLYALNKDYKVLEYYYIAHEELTVRKMAINAIMMANRNPGAKYIFAADNSFGIYSSYKDAQVTKSMEDRVIFKTMLETEGIRLV